MSKAKVKKIINKPSMKRENLVKEMKNLGTLFNSLNRKQGQLALTTGQHFGQLEQKGTDTWVLLWAVIEWLKNNANLTEESLEECRQVVTKQWIAEKVAQLKPRLTVKQAICDACAYIGPTEQFEEADLCCPHCGESDVYFGELPAPEEKK